MTEKVREQIMEVRDSGFCNMFSLNEVQRYAFDRGMYELVNYIEERRGEYCHFILTGEAPMADKE